MRKNEFQVEKNRVSLETHKKSLQSHTEASVLLVVLLPSVIKSKQKELVTLYLTTNRSSLNGRGLGKTQGSSWPTTVWQDKSSIKQMGPRAWRSPESVPQTQEPQFQNSDWSCPLDRSPLLATSRWGQGRCPWVTWTTISWVSDISNTSKN